MNNIVPPIVSLFAGLVSLALSVAEGDALVAAISVAVAVPSAVLAYQSFKWAVEPVPCFLSAVTCLAGAFVLLYVFEWYNGDNMALAYSEGAVAWMMVFPAAYLLLKAIANMSGAVLNRILAGAFVGFLSIGLMTLVWVYLSVFHVSELDVKYWFAQEMAYLFVDIVLSAVSAVAIAHILKGKHYRLARRSVEE